MEGSTRVDASDRAKRKMGRAHLPERWLRGGHPSVCRLESHAASVSFHPIRRSRPTSLVTALSQRASLGSRNGGKRCRFLQCATNRCFQALERMACSAGKPRGQHRRSQSNRPSCCRENQDFRDNAAEVLCGTGFRCLAQIVISPSSLPFQ